MPNPAVQYISVRLMLRQQQLPSIEAKVHIVSNKKCRVVRANASILY
jgi:hypothetical protein